MKPNAKPSKKQAAREERQRMLTQQRERMQVPDPFAPENLKKMGLRLGIPLVVTWIVAFAIPGWIAKAVAGVLTLVLLGIVLWATRFAKKSQAVANIVRGADSAEARQNALDQLDSDFKEGDVAATFAKAQLQMQDAPRTALQTLEALKLDKLMAPVADECRSQRAMIHLMLGEPDKARALVDNIDLGRHKEAKTRATLASVVGEAWARSGQAKKAVELLEAFDTNDELYKDLRPQLYRSLAFAYAWASQTKKMKQVLRKMRGINVQLLTGFITKKRNPNGVSPRGVHPILEKEAFNMVMKSGAVQRKMQVKRM